MKLSILIPVYNEEATLAKLTSLVQAVPIDKEIILINDGSTDGTREIMQSIAAGQNGNCRVLHHATNRGKGAAIITGLKEATGEIVLIQDADLEYDPNDYPALLEPFRDEKIQVVYGSRILNKNARSSFSFYWGGRLLSWITNILFGSNITDEPTGYKAFRTELLRDMELTSRGFEFCPEVTAKILRRKIPIHEVPISYHPRDWSEGKKITWKDGITAVRVLIKYRFTRR